MKRHPFAAVPALTLGLALGGGALAQSAPSPDQAASLETQIHAALVALADGTITIPPRPVELQAEGDHYAVRVPLAEFGPVEPGDAAFTAQARLLANGAWSLENGRFPEQFQITARMPVPDAPDSGVPGTTHTESFVYEIKLGRQERHGQFDPSYATPTSSMGSVAPVDVFRRGSSTAGLTHFDQVSSQSSITPIDGQRVNLLSDVTAQGYATEAELPDGATVKLTAQALQVQSGLTGLAHDRVLPLVHVVMDMLRGDGVPSAEAFRGEMRRTLVAANGLLTGGRIEESATAVRFAYGGHAGAMQKIDITASGDAPQGILALTLGFTLDGLVIDDLPPAFAAYVPTHLGFRPSVSNLSVSALTAIGMSATAPGGEPLPAAEIAALFNHGGIGLAIDDLGLDVGGAKFTGVGKFTATGPQAIAGTAEITATGLDALIATVQADKVAMDALPVLIFLKGIAHTSGGRATWQIAVAHGKALVNGIDLAKMAGAMH